MKSKPANHTVRMLQQLKRELPRLSEEALLDALSRCIESNNTQDVDTITRAVDNLSRCIVQAAEAVTAAANILKYVQTLDVHGRVSQIEDCIRCKQPALPHPISGFCSECNKLWKASGHEDRSSFVASYGKLVSGS